MLIQLYGIFGNDFPTRLKEVNSGIPSSQATRQKEVFFTICCAGFRFLSGACIAVLFFASKVLTYNIVVAFCLISTIGGLVLLYVRTWLHLRHDGHQLLDESVLNLHVENQIELQDEGYESKHVIILTSCHVASSNRAVQDSVVTEEGSSIVRRSIERSTRDRVEGDRKFQGKFRK